MSEDVKLTLGAAVPRSPELSLAIPCYNEEDCIRDTLPPLVQTFLAAGVDLELVLVDNGSTDRTGALIDELMADGLPIAKVGVAVNRGYSNGIMQGLSRCRAPVIGFLHADGQVAPIDVLRTYRLMEGREQRVMTKVRRRFRQDSWRRKIVSIIYNGLMQVSFGWLGSIDINGSPKIFSKRVFDAMRLRSRDWFLDPEIVLKAKGLGLRVIEIDVEGHARHGGASHVRPATMAEFLKNIWIYRTGGHMREWRRGVVPVEEHEPAATMVAAPSVWDRVRVIEQARFEDERGFLHKVLQASQLGQPKRWRGEVYVTAAHPGEAKGNHYHRRMGEWFCVIQGEAALELCDPASDRRRTISIRAAEPVAVYVPAGLAHAVVNTGQTPMLCVAWAEREHDPDDVFPHDVHPRDVEAANR